MTRRGRLLVSPDQGKRGGHGYVNEEWSVTVSFLCSSRQRHLETSERSVAYKAHREKWEVGSFAEKNGKGLVSVRTP